MYWVAIKMLLGDRGKYLGMIVGVTFGSLLIAQQASIFCGLMIRTYSEIRDIAEPDVWVMDRNVNFVDEFKLLPENDLYRIRGVPGVEWAVKLYKGLSRARVQEGNYQQVILLGLDDGSLTGAPQSLLMGSVEELRRPDAVIIDDAGYIQLWPEEPLQLGKTFEMNDRRAVVVGICKASRTFQTLPIIYTRFNQAMNYSPQERRTMTYALVKSDPQAGTQEVCRRIAQQTGLKAMDRREFAYTTMMYYFNNTGIPLNFAITIVLGFIVGSAIAGQTFYMFTLDNLKQFAVLKAMGTSNRRIVQMILLQASVVALVGFGLGLGPAAIFGEAIKGAPRLAFYMPWQVVACTATGVVMMLLVSSILSIRRALVVEPAIVFQS